MQVLKSKLLKRPPNFLTRPKSDFTTEIFISGDISSGITNSLNFNEHFISFSVYFNELVNQRRTSSTPSRNSITSVNTFAGSP